MLTFVSWVRRGLAASFANPDDGVTPAGPTGTLPVQVNFEGITVDIPEPVSLPLIGPGEIVGLNSIVITRLWPRPDDMDAEFRSYALIEFDQADLPWRYTPATSSAPASTQQDRLRPWFSLLVLAANEGSLSPPTPEQKLQVLSVSNQTTLPSQTELWAWSHTQFEGAEIDEGLASQKIKGDPGLFTARLMSPRLLVQNTEYIACLVPTFERGRLAGLGLDPNAPELVDALKPAWNSTLTTPVDLPVYFSWRFRTGTIANFEDAARLLKPFVLPATVGRRDMDVQEPGLDLPEASTGSLPVEGALMSVAAFHEGPPEWPETERDEFIEELAERLNAPAAAQAADPVLAPPLYGQWYAADDTLDEGSNPPWYHQLNSDPRNRVGAALGTQVIQNEQQALLASGWDQVEEIRDINEKLRVVQLGRGLLLRLFRRHFETVTFEHFYHLTSKVQARVACGDESVCRRLKDSPVFNGFLSSLWLRLSRPLGPVGRIQGRPELAAIDSDLLRQLNACRGPVAPPEIPPPHDPGDGPFPGGGTKICLLLDTLEEQGSEVLLFWALVIFWVYRKLLVTQNGDCWWIAIRALRLALILIRIAIDPDDARRRCRWLSLTFGSSDILGARPAPTLVSLPSIPSGFSFPPAVTTLPTLGTPGTPDSPLAGQIRAALAAVLDALVVPPALACPPSMDLDTCSTSLRTKLVPTVTVGKRVTSRISTVGVDWDPTDPLEPMLVHPEYENPMYVPLNDISSEWLLPGISGLKPDTVSLAVTNQKFVEAYMVGLNHEMTRELLWNEFPTDQRGTYFRQFWSISSHILENGSTKPADELRDIDPIRLWAEDAELGENSPRPPPPGGANLPFLVLVVKAQLIRKYPNVIVYAQRVNEAGTSLSGEDPRYPIFDAMIGGDTAFYGFDLTEAEIRADNRWYFVFEEQPGEPKFADEETLPRDADHKYTADPASFATSAGLFAKDRFLRPFRLGIQGVALLPEEEI
jgi:hypothetical protein